MEGMQGISIKSSLKDPEIWKRFVEKYDSQVIRYAINWAHIMEEKIISGAKLEDIAQASSQEADVEGITSFMYRAAISFLSNGWKYGEQLRCWYNLSIQIGNESEKANASGGVLT